MWHKSVPIDLTTINFLDINSQHGFTVSEWFLRVVSTCSQTVAVPSCSCYFSLLTSVHDVYVTLLLGLIPLTLPLVSHRKFRPSICAPITISLLKSLGRNWPQSSFFPVEIIPSRPEFSAHSFTSDVHPPRKKGCCCNATLWHRFVILLQPARTLTATTRELCICFCS